MSRPEETSLLLPVLFFPSPVLLVTIAMKSPSNKRCAILFSSESCIIHHLHPPKRDILDLLPHRRCRQPAVGAPPADGAAPLHLAAPALAPPCPSRERRLRPTLSLPNPYWCPTLPPRHPHRRAPPADAPCRSATASRACTVLPPRGSAVAVASRRAACLIPAAHQPSRPGPATAKPLMHDSALAKFSLYQLACNSTTCSVSDSSHPEMLQLCCSSWDIQPLSLLPMPDFLFDYFGRALTIVLFRHCSSKEYNCSSALYRNRTSS